MEVVQFAHILGLSASKYQLNHFWWICVIHSQHEDTITSSL